jgi:hypothetical protein
LARYSASSRVHGVGGLGISPYLIDPTTQVLDLVQPISIFSSYLTKKSPFCGNYKLLPLDVTAPNPLTLISDHAPYPDVAASCLSGETHLRPCAHSLAMDIGTISSWTSRVVSAALPGGVRDRLFARKPSGGYKAEWCNKSSTLGVLAW